MDEYWVVLTGTPASGFDVIGPFKSVQEAEEWATMEAITYWITPLIRP